MMNSSKSKQLLSKMMTGCINKTVPKQLSNVGNNTTQPTANIQSVEVVNVSLQRLTLLAKVSVHNPYSFTISNCEITFSLKSIDREIAHGKVNQCSLKANDDTVVDVHVTALLKDGVKTLFKDIRQDWDIDYTLDLIIVMDYFPFITSNGSNSKKTIVLSFKGELKLPTLSDLVKNKFG